ncbi:hypothetical protein KC845_03720 [Candidatus Kaiserbacteria bacterium]|nr:hypothetical protein [Candidatus Kaiserbacteria bacterium]
MQTEWAQMIQYSSGTLGSEVAMLTPKIIIAFLMIVAGFMIGGILKTLIKKIFSKLGIDDLLAKAGLADLAKKAGYSLSAGGFVGTLVKWFVLIVFFIVALDVLGLNQVTFFFSDVVLGYLPKVIVATLIFFGGIIIATVVEGVVVGSARAANFKSPDFLGRFAKYAILVFTGLAVLSQLDIAADLVEMLFAGMVFAISLALGLSFGLGGKEAAARYIESATRDSGRSH